ncbi:MAG TPA: LamG-like jellyroll fold domain-containing protein, partial [Xanthomonadales bacterium]|nr:LamG-like jellyroll fold domain-containing protein [Xanthomonadales bacterium]
MRTVAIGFALCLSLAACHSGSTSIPPGSRGAGSPNAQARSPQSIQTYYSTVKADSPLIYYRMNETSGTTAFDTSGHNYDATYGSSVTLGGPSVVAGDAAPTFPGGTASSAKVLSSPANSAFALTGAMTVEFWVKVPSTVTSDTILYTQSFGNGNFGYPAYVALSGGSSPFFTLQIHTNGGDIATYPAPVLGASNHVVMTWTGTTLTGYVNGVSAGTATGTGPITNYASPYTGFSLGGPNDPHTGF